jgi:SAM-dependent methyltransferase
MSVQLYQRQPAEIRDSIPLFAVDRYWGKSPESMLLDGLRLIESEGWEAFDKKYYGWLDYTYDESRADWRFNIPVTKDFVVLDTGAGMGRITIPLARVVKKVVAFDSSWSRLKYLKLRLEKEKLDNVDLLLADIFDLPLADGTFDLIVMNGVLEWVGKTDRFTNPREAQIACLKICQRLLKPGGYLYIGIENRWALSYLRGHDHSGLRFTSYMPRILANIYTRVRGRGRYDTYTYSRGGYLKLLAAAGFESQKTSFYLPYPGYNVPRIVVPYEHLHILSYLIANVMPAGGLKRTLARLLTKNSLLLKFYRLGFFSFNIIVKK